MLQAMNQIDEIRTDSTPRLPHVCLAIMCVIDGKRSMDTIKHAMRSANNQPGVDYARPAYGPVNVIAVHYNRKNTSATQIAERLRRAGHNIVLVSC
jgi:hypothetical protein